MKYVLEGHEPALALKYFEDISAIPRGSNNEAAVAAFIKGKAEEFGLYCRADEANNVIVKKPASAGLEGCPAVILQAHMDMVCEKNADTVHDFKNDGLKLVLSGDTITADGTTLGADDGKGVAYMLALMDSDSDGFPHPPLEFLFTSGEEIGFIGAFALDVSDISGKRIIGLDAGPEDSMYITSAGAQDVSFYVNTEAGPAAGEAVSVKVKGLQGGHSAVRITDELGNANKIMGRLLHNAAKAADFRLCCINGGLMFNAIPRECEAVAVMDSAQKEAFAAAIKKVTAEIKAELSASDPGLIVEFSPAKAESAFSKKASSAVIEIIYNVPNGVRMMSKEIAGLPVTSTNMGVVKTEGGRVRINSMLRSSSHTCSDDYIDNMTTIAKLCGADETETGTWLPAWPYKAGSDMRALAQRMYFERHGEYMKEEAVHGGLEMGVFSEKIPGLDIVTLGCDSGDEHTVTEWMSLSSFGSSYQFIKDFIAELAKQ